MKKTALDDDAILYNQPQEQSTKQTWKELNGRQKLKFFIDYYLLKILVVTAILGVAGYLLWLTVLRKEPETAFYTAVMDTIIPEPGKQELAEKIADVLELQDGAQQIMLDDSFVMDTAGMKLSAVMSLGEIDVFLCNADTFKRLAGQGILMDLTVLRETAPEDLSDLLAGRELAANGYGTEPESGADPALDLSGQGEALPYGIDLSGNEIIKTYLPTLENPVLGLSVNGKRQETSLRFLAWLLQAE